LIKSPIVIRAKKPAYSAKVKQPEILRKALPKTPTSRHSNSRSLNGSDKENISHKARNQAGSKKSPVLATLKQHTKTKVDNFKFLKIDKKLYKFEVLEQDSDYGFGEGKGHTGFKDQLCSGEDFSEVSETGRGFPKMRDSVSDSSMRSSAFL